MASTPAPRLDRNGSSMLFFAKTLSTAEMLLQRGVDAGGKYLIIQPLIQLLIQLSI